jgi:hypothetical protein
MAVLVVESGVSHRYHWYVIVGAGPPVAAGVAVTGIPNWVEPESVTFEIAAALEVNRPQ